MLVAQMEDLVGDLYDQLNLTKLEYEETLMEASPLEEVLTNEILCLVGKLLTNWMYNREAFKQTMKKIWLPTKPICFHYELGFGIFFWREGRQREGDQGKPMKLWKIINIIERLRREATS